MLLESLVASIIVQAIYLVVPGLHPTRVGRHYPPYSRTLSRRLLSIFVPLILIMTFVLIYAVTATTLDMAVSYAVDEMGRDAKSAAQDVPHFIRTGQALLADVASDQVLTQGGQRALNDHLKDSLRKSAAGR